MMNSPRFLCAVSLTLALGLVTAAPLHSGTVQPPPPVLVLPPSGGVVDPVFVPTPPAGPTTGGAASNAATKAIVVELDAARDFCRRMPSEEYRIDCLGDRLQTIAKDLPSSGDYADAKRVLADAGGRLRSLAKANASPVLPSGTMRSPSNPAIRSSTPLTPVARDRLDTANAQALQIIEEAETLLLRSTENSAARKVHYERISTALGSNKVLLRST